MVFAFLTCDGLERLNDDGKGQWEFILLWNYYIKWHFKKIYTFGFKYVIFQGMERKLFVWRNWLDYIPIEIDEHMH